MTVHAADKDGLECLIRYCARPALSMERMSQTSEGLIAYRLRHAQNGKATHRVMRSIDILARIAATEAPPAALPRRVRTALVLAKVVRASGRGPHANGSEDVSIPFVEPRDDTAEGGQGEAFIQASIDCERI